MKLEIVVVGGYEWPFDMSHWDNISVPATACHTNINMGLLVEGLSEVR